MASEVTLSSMAFLIRPEDLNDHAAIDTLNREAFESNVEADLVQLLRDRGELSISLVAIDDFAIVGHVAASEVSVQDKNIHMVGIGPIAVSVFHRKQGIGASLMQAILNVAKEEGFKSAVVLGDPKYYGRFGFQTASNFNLENEYNEADAFMAKELEVDSLKDISGLVKYVRAFSQCNA